MLDRVITLNREKRFEIRSSCRLGSSCVHSVAIRLFFLQQYYVDLFFPYFCCRFVPPSVRCWTEASLYIRRKISLGSWMQITKNKYILPLTIKGTQGCFSFKLDTSFNNASHQISPPYTHNFCHPKHLSPESLIIAAHRLVGVIKKKRRFTHIQTNYYTKNKRSKCYVIMPVRLLYLLCSSLNHLALCLLLSIFPQTVNFFFLHS